jgi:predicted phosphodiesterase
VSKRITSTVLSVSDLQYPFLDRPVWKAVLQFAKELRPNHVIVNGDGFDFYDLSSHATDPARLGRLQHEIDGFEEEVLVPLQKLKATKLSYVMGNHEHRLRKYLWHQAPALSGIHGMTVPALLRIDAHGFTYEERHIQVGKHLAVMHGHLLSPHSALTARAHYLRHGTSVLVGHSHRIGSFMARNLSGVHEAVEQGCLCELDVEWDRFPNWQQGFAVVYVFEDGTFSIQVVKVVNRQFLLFGAKTYEVRR